MSSRKNKFSSALRHLNSSQIDEKIKKLEEQPTNSTSGIYTLSPPDPAADPTVYTCLLYTSPSPRDKRQSRMPSSA